jgi:molybdopterin-guanine dinucleotide biosynthesis protein A
MSAKKIIGLILAGGRSTRMGGRDKAWVTLAGKPLLAHVVTRLTAQVDLLVINTNAAPESFAQFGLPLLPDRFPGYVGPLAGIHAGLLAHPDSLLVAVAVDLPGLPGDLVARLQTGLGHHLCAYAWDGRQHALAILFRPGSAAAVQQYLDRGARNVKDFLAEHGAAVLFDRPQDHGLYRNLNTPEELACADRELTDPRTSIIGHG